VNHAARACIAACATAGACLSATGCSATPIDVGRDPDILWWSDLESGNSDDWTARGPVYGEPFQTGTAMINDTPGLARSGQWALRSTLTATFGTPPATALMVRGGDLPAEGYYSAWFYVPSQATPVDYWAFFVFRARTTAGDPTTAVEVWDIELTGTGPLAVGPPPPPVVQVFSHVTNRPVPVSPTTPPVPFGRWFQIEAYFRPALDTSGRLTVWQDGVLVVDVSAQQTTTTPYIEWGVGSASDGLMPATANVYVDDVAISRRRLGPSFPPFWRP
jgi:hypothetical protein